MNKNTIALLVVLLLIGVGLYALADYQHGKALAPVSVAPQGGGLVINGIAVSPSTSVGTGTAAPSAEDEAAPAISTSGESCP